MAKAEWRDDGKRCFVCAGTSLARPLQRWDVTTPVRSVFDGHAECIGVWLMKNPKMVIGFHQGERV